MKTRTVTASGVLLCLVMAGGCVGGEASPSSAPAPTSSGVSKKPAARLLEYSATLEAVGFSGVVEVRRNGRVLLSEAYGDAERETGAPNTTQTRFRAASLTKQFTAVAILILEQQGKLSVGDPVCEYLPSCPPSWQPITVHDLLSHTSGLQGYTPVGEAESAELLGDRPSHLDLTLRMQSAPLLHEPGKRSNYTNTGYVVLGAVIESLSGLDYGAFLRSTILDPLGMTETTTSWSDIPPFMRALGYLDDTRFAQPSQPREYADAALVTTASDLGRWNHFMLTETPPLVSERALARMREPQAGTPEGDKFGYGVVLRGTGNEMIIEHTGAYPGFRSYNAVHPNALTSVTVLSNMETQDTTAIGHTLLDLTIAR
jgi:CubicO group peptidase (beta-lactamase class C family)